MIRLSMTPSTTVLKILHQLIVSKYSRMAIFISAKYNYSCLFASAINLLIELPH